ncbi:MAG: hypothetical protein IJH65_10650 [Methanobrevibacter sp.]|nr:hypothetical protein [Methanobrevibacter sp.]
MNKKINTICFIFLLLFLVSAVSAADNENETLQQAEQDSQQDLYAISADSLDELKADNSEKQTTPSTTEVTKEKVRLSAPDVTMYYKDGSKFKVTLKDSKKKAIKNAKIKIAINGVTYNKVTDSKGTTSINLNLNSGNYVVLTTFDGTNKFKKASVKSTVTIKSTIKCSDFTKYYKNTDYYYAKFYDNKGNPLKNTNVKIKLNGKKYTIKTNYKGLAGLAVDLKPGKYTIIPINIKTTESITKTVTIKSLIETNDLVYNETDTGKFNVKIFNSNGKISPYTKVIVKVDGKTFKIKTNKKGIATLNLDLNYGKYKIITEYSGINSVNKIIVNRVIKTTSYIHTTLIPNYVNVTLPYVYAGSAYSLKAGANGIVKMPKIELFTIQVGDKSYLFSTGPATGTDAIEIGYQNYLIPFGGGAIKNNINKTKLEGNGIVISRIKDFTQIDYRSNTSNNVELFGFYADKGLENSETLTYMQNDKITAKINFITHRFDENGVKLNLGKYYQKTIYDFNYKSYDEITKNNSKSIKFLNTNTPVTFNIFGKSIIGYVSKEDIITKFIVNGKEELEKQETISYGLAKKYRKSLGFEVLQTYTMINVKITSKILENWANSNNLYLNRFGVMNVYGMHLASLETAWLADKLADEYSSKFNVAWNRENTLTILGGINLDDTYLNILNADMGIEVKGSEDNIVSFRLINSLQLPNLEEYSLQEVSKRFWNITTNSQDNIFIAIANNKFSITQFGEMMYIFTEDGSNSAIFLNTTSGVANVVYCHNNATYKGASLSTSRDCCSVGIMPQDIISGIRNSLKLFSSAQSKLCDLLDQIHPMSKMIYKVLTFMGGKVLKGATKATLNILGTMVFIQQVGVDARTEFVEEEDWYTVMDTFTFTRPGYQQNKKVYNIPNNKGGYDYIEVEINSDLTLNRNNAVYISNGKTKNLTKAETYKYFSDESWSPINVPTKYWDESWKGVVK